MKAYRDRQLDIIAKLRKKVADFVSRKHRAEQAGDLLIIDSCTAEIAQLEAEIEALESEWESRIIAEGSGPGYRKMWLDLRQTEEEQAQLPTLRDLHNSGD